MPKKNKTKQLNNNKSVGKQNKKQNSKKSQQVKIMKSPAYEPNAILTGPNLKKSINEQIRAAIKPALRSINTSVAELTNQREHDVGREQLRGRQLLGNVGNYYDKLAAEETARLAAQSASGAGTIAAVGQVQQNARTGLTQAQSALQAGIGENTTGQEIGARQQLAKVLAEQQGSLASQAQAQGTQAASGVNNWQGLLGALAGASGVRANSQYGDIAQGITNSVGKIRNEYGSDIGKLKNSKLNLLLERPEIANKLYNQAIERERNLGLSRATLGLKEKESKSGINYAKVSGQENLRKVKEEARIRNAELDRLGASETEKRAEEHSFREKELQIQKEMSNSKGGKKKPYEGYQTFTKTFSYLRGSPVKPKTLAESKKARKAAYDKLVNFGATPQVAKAVIKKYVKQYKKSQSIGSVVKRAASGF